MGPLYLWLVERLLSKMLFLLKNNHSLLHLCHSVAHLILRPHNRFPVWLQEHIENKGLSLAQVRQTQFKCSFMYKALQLLLKLIDPLHCKQRLERRVLHRIRNVGKRVKRQKLRCLWQLRACIIQVLFEFCLLDLQSLVGPLSLLVVRMEDIDYEVDVQVKLQLFCVEIRLDHLSWNQLLPCFEELFGLAAIEWLGKHAK